MDADDANNLVAEMPYNHETSGAITTVPGLKIGSVENKLGNADSGLILDNLDDDFMPKIISVFSLAPGANEANNYVSDVIDVAKSSFQNSVNDAEKPQEIGEDIVQQDEAVSVASAMLFVEPNVDAYGNNESNKTLVALDLDDNIEYQPAMKTVKYEANASQSLESCPDTSNLFDYATLEENTCSLLPSPVHCDEKEMPKTVKRKGRRRKKSKLRKVSRNSGSGGFFSVEIDGQSNPGDVSQKNIIDVKGSSNKYVHLKDISKVRTRGESSESSVLKPHSNKEKIATVRLQCETVSSEAGESKSDKSVQIITYKKRSDYAKGNKLSGLSLEQASSTSVQDTDKNGVENQNRFTVREKNINRLKDLIKQQEEALAKLRMKRKEPTIEGSQEKKSKLEEIELEGQSKREGKKETSMKPSLVWTESFVKEASSRESLCQSDQTSDFISVTVKKEDIPELSCPTLDNGHLLQQTVLVKKEDNANFVDVGTNLTQTTTVPCSSYQCYPTKVLDVIQNKTIMRLTKEDYFAQRFKKASCPDTSKNTTGTIPSGNIKDGKTPQETTTSSYLTDPSRTLKSFTESSSASLLSAKVGQRLQTISVSSGSVSFAKLPSLRPLAMKPNKVDEVAASTSNQTMGTAKKSPAITALLDGVESKAVASQGKQNKIAVSIGGKEVLISCSNETPLKLQIDQEMRRLQEKSSKSISSSSTISNPMPCITSNVKRMNHKPSTNIATVAPRTSSHVIAPKNTQRHLHNSTSSSSSMQNIGGKTPSVNTVSASQAPSAAKPLSFSQKLSELLSLQESVSSIIQSQVTVTKATTSVPKLQVVNSPASPNAMRVVLVQQPGGQFLLVPVADPNFPGSFVIQPSIPPALSANLTFSLSLPVVTSPTTTSSSAVRAASVSLLSTPSKISLQQAQAKVTTAVTTPKQAQQGRGQVPTSPPPLLRENFGKQPTSTLPKSPPTLTIRPVKSAAGVLIDPVARRSNANPTLPLKGNLESSTATVRSSIAQSTFKNVTSQNNTATQKALTHSPVASISQQNRTVTRSNVTSITPQCTISSVLPTTKGGTSMAVKVPTVNRNVSSSTICNSTSVITVNGKQGNLALSRLVNPLSTGNPPSSSNQFSTGMPSSALGTKSNAASYSSNHSTLNATTTSMTSAKTSLINTKSNSVNSVTLVSSKASACSNTLHKVPVQLGIKEKLFKLVDLEKLQNIFIPKAEGGKIVRLIGLNEVVKSLLNRPVMENKTGKIENCKNSSLSCQSITNESRRENSSVSKAKDEKISKGFIETVKTPTDHPVKEAGVLRDHSKTCPRGLAEPRKENVFISQDEYDKVVGRLKEVVKVPMNQTHKEIKTGKVDESEGRSLTCPGRTRDLIEKDTFIPKAFSGKTINGLNEVFKSHKSNPVEEVRAVKSEGVKGCLILHPTRSTEASKENVLVHDCKDSETVKVMSEDARSLTYRPGKERDEDSERAKVVSEVVTSIINEIIKENKIEKTDNRRDCPFGFQGKADDSRKEMNEDDEP